MRPDLTHTCFRQHAERLRWELGLTPVGAAAYDSDAALLPSPAVLAVAGLQSELGPGGEAAYGVDAFFDGARALADTGLGEFGPLYRPIRLYPRRGPEDDAPPVRLNRAPLWSADDARPGVLQQLETLRTADPQDPAHRAGVVMTAASGAGKSIEGLHAVFRMTEADDPLNAGIPVVLPSDVDLKGRGTAEAFVGLLARYAGAGVSGAYLEQALRVKGTPRLVIHLDLNAVAGGRQLGLATALAAFQEEYGRYGHRCVVAYRSVGDQSGILNALCGGGAFLAFDLEPLGIGYVKTYLEHRGKILQTLRPGFGPQDAEDGDARKARLDGLLGRVGAADASILTVPLLMHFLSILPEDELQGIDSVFGLYRGVVARLLNREKRFTEISGRRGSWATTRPRSRG